MTENQLLAIADNQAAYDRLRDTVAYLNHNQRHAAVNTLTMDFTPSPLGTMCLVADAQALYLLEFVDRKNIDKEFAALLKQCNAVIVYGENAIIQRSKAQLADYFCGRRQRFDLPTRLFGTDFQIRVWQSLLTIPYGETISYAEQAQRLNRATAVRAVANSNGMNRMALIYPCHRVIGSNGKLTGYAGKIERKAWLLAHERRHADDTV